MDFVPRFVWMCSKSVEQIAMTSSTSDFSLSFVWTCCGEWMFCELFYNTVQFMKNWFFQTNGNWKFYGKHRITIETPFSDSPDSTANNKLCLRRSLAIGLLIGVIVLGCSQMFVFVSWLQSRVLPQSDSASSVSHSNMSTMSEFLGVFGMCWNLNFS